MQEQNPKEIDGVNYQKVIIVGASGEEVNSTKGAIDVSMQDQTTPDISFYMAQILDTITLLSSVAIDDEVVNVRTTGHVPVIGQYACFKEGKAFLQVEITSVVLVSVNDYTIGIAMPFDFAYTTSGGCSIQNVNMNIDGSLGDIKFAVSPSGLDDTEEWDITRMIIVAVMTTSGDDGKFCNIAALNKGMYFRTKNGITKNLFNAKVNADFGEESGGDLQYTVRSGGQGDFGMRARVTFNGQDKRGVVKRLKAADSDEFQGWVRDNLSGVEIVQLRVKLQGQVVNN